LREHITHNRTGDVRFKAGRVLYLRAAKNAMVQYAV
jgi:hypothetical protein